MRQLQRDYGNQYVQRLVGHIHLPDDSEKAKRLGTKSPVIARQAERPPGVSTPKTLYEGIGPLATAWTKTHPDVEGARATLSRVVTELRAAPSRDQATIFDDRIVGAEQTLAAALRAHLDAVVPPFHEMFVQQIGEAGGGPDPALRTMLKPYAHEIERSRRELDVLQRVFSITTAQSVEEKYRVEVKPIPGGGCMTAMYKGFEVIFSPDESKALLKQVYRDAKKILDKTGRDTNSVDRIMETLRSQGRAGSAKASRYDRRQNTWAPTVESQVMDLIVPSIPGWFFFGLSISGAYHTVTLAVDTTSGTPKVFWLDQFTRGFTKEVTGNLDAKMQESWLQPSYGFTTSKVWPIIPTPASSVELPQ